MNFQPNMLGLAKFRQPMQISLNWQWVSIYQIVRDDVTYLVQSAHDDKMLALALDPSTTSDEAADKSEENFWEGSGEEKAVEEDEGDIGLGLMNGLYQFNMPVSNALIIC